MIKWNGRGVVDAHRGTRTSRNEGTRSTLDCLSGLRSSASDGHDDNEMNGMAHGVEATHAGGQNIALDICGWLKSRVTESRYWVAPWNYPPFRLHLPEKGGCFPSWMHAGRIPKTIPVTDQNPEVASFWALTVRSTHEICRRKIMTESNVNPSGRLRKCRISRGKKRYWKKGAKVHDVEDFLHEVQVDSVEGVSSRKQTNDSLFTVDRKPDPNNAKLTRRQMAALMKRLKKTEPVNEKESVSKRELRKILLKKPKKEGSSKANFSGSATTEARKTYDLWGADS
uniref:Ribosome biogenesis protein NOP53 n=1 Tax=Setaria digitata TaxID=48799 RepID=A0A915PVF2_9BILA